MRLINKDGQWRIYDTPTAEGISYAETISAVVIRQVESIAKEYEDKKISVHSLYHSLRHLITAMLPFVDSTTKVELDNILSQTEKDYFAFLKEREAKRFETMAETNNKYGAFS